MSGGPDLVGLLYRADWAQLSLLAVTSDGTRVLRARSVGSAGGGAAGSDAIAPRLGAGGARRTSKGRGQGPDCRGGAG